RFGDRRDAVVFVDRAGAGVVGGDGFGDLVGIVLVFDEQVTQVARAGFDVLGGGVRIGVEVSCGAGHELHYSDGAFWGYGGGVVIGFGSGDAVYDFGRQPVMESRESYQLLR